MKKITTLLFLLFAVMVQAQEPNWQWAVTTGLDESNFVKDIAHDAQGNVYMTGMFNSTSIKFGNVTLNNSDSGSNVFVAKYSPSGSVLWAKSFNSGNIDDSWGVATDANGNVYITGKFFAASMTFGGFTLTNTAGHYCIFVVKLDADGNVIWANKGNGSVVYLEVEDIAVDGENNVIITGYHASGTITFNDITLPTAGNANLYIVKYNEDGEVLWATHQTQTSQNRADSVDVDADGNIYITGFYTSAGLYGLPQSNSGANAYVAKYDPSGNFLWAAGSTAPGTGDVYSYDIHVTNNGKVVITGSFNTGTVQFGDTLLTVTPGGFNDDVFVAQYSATGEFEWAKRTGGSKNDRGYKLASDASGNVYVNGFFESQDMAFGGVALTKDDNYSKWSFVAKYDSSGNEGWAKKMEETTTFSTSPNGGLTIDATGNIYVAGGAYDDSVFGNITIEDGGIFLAKLSNETAGVDSFDKSAVKLYPNPVNDILTVDGVEDILTVVVYNTIGQQVLNAGDNNVVDMSSLQAGLYLVEVTSDKGKSSQKVIKK